MDHNVKKRVFGGGGAVAGVLSIITLSILLHGYHLIHINVCYKEAI